MEQDGLVEGIVADVIAVFRGRLEAEDGGLTLEQAADVAAEVVKALKRYADDLSYLAKEMEQDQ